MTLRLIILALVALTLAPASSRAQGRGSVTVAAASDLQTALPALAAAFERTTGIKAIVTFGSSGNFVAQIQNGAPFDIFFSADADYPRRLASDGHVDPASVYEYAIGRLVLWTRNDSGVDITPGLPALHAGIAKRIAIANPAVAPYGRAATAALRSEQLYDAVVKKLVFAENVSQAAQLAESGNAEIALIGHALALDRRLQSGGRFVEIPARTHPPIVQAVAIVSASRNKANARALLEFVKSSEARTTIASFGFEVPKPVR
jgi:molybdate transport system substrate-binding protein